MHIPVKQLETRLSNIPNAGKGLFTKTDIGKDSLIIEYKGRVTTWDEVKDDAANAYLYYVSEKFVIDAGPFPRAIARFANDAQGITKVKGMRNNAVYERHGDKVFIKAVRDISAGDEILVSYGKEYWDTHRRNERIDREARR